MTNEHLDKLWAGMRDKTKLLILECDDFAVIIDKDEHVFWETSDSYDKKGGHKDLSAWNHFLNQSAYVEITPCSHLDATTRLDFKRLVAEATVRALDNDYANAMKMLDDAKKFVSARNQETSRFWYLSSSGLITAVLLLIGIILWVFKAGVIAVIGFVAFVAIISAVAGATGALLSVILRMGKTQLNCSSGEKLHYLEAASRIVAGAISGVAILLAVKAGVVGVAVFDAPNSLSGQLLLALLAGASERWIPSIISKFDGDVTLKNLKPQLNDEGK